MNQYLKEKIGITLTEEAIIAQTDRLEELKSALKNAKAPTEDQELIARLEEMIELTKQSLNELKESIKDRTYIINKISIFPLQITKFIKKIIEDFNNKNYQIVWLKNPDLSENKKYFYILANDTIKQIPTVTEPLFWEYVKQNDIIILATTNKINKDLNQITSISLSKKRSKKDALDWNNSFLYYLDENLQKILTDFINRLILYRYNIYIYDKNQEAITEEEIEKVYQTIFFPKILKKTYHPNN